MDCVFYISILLLTIKNTAIRIQILRNILYYNIKIFININVR